MINRFASPTFIILRYQQTPENPKKSRGPGGDSKSKDTRYKQITSTKFQTGWLDGASPD